MKQFFLSLLEVLEVLLVALISIYLIYTFVAQPFMVQGASMEPTFSTGDYLVVDEVTYLLRDPQRGEVVVFENPANPEEFYIKRVIGLPGEVIEIRGNDLFIDEVRVNEEYLSSGANIRGEYKAELGEGEYYVMGDNRLKSSDSRDWGPLSRGAIIGTVRLRFWPINQLELFKLEIDA